MKKVFTCCKTALLSPRRVFFPGLARNSTFMLRFRAGEIATFAHSFTLVCGFFFRAVAVLWMKFLFLHEERQRGARRNFALASTHLSDWFHAHSSHFCYCGFKWHKMKTLLVVCVAFTLVALSVAATAEQKLKNCNEVRAAYSSKGFNVNDVPNKGVNGEFSICFYLRVARFWTLITAVMSSGSQCGGRGRPMDMEGSAGGPRDNDQF